MSNKQTGKKLVAPIVIVLVIALYLVGYFILFFCMDEIAFWIKGVIGLVGLALIGVAVAMLFERIKEIRSGEEDDLSQY